MAEHLNRLLITIVKQQILLNEPKPTLSSNLKTQLAPAKPHIPSPHFLKLTFELKFAANYTPLVTKGFINPRSSLLKTTLGYYLWSNTNFAHALNKTYLSPQLTSPLSPQLNLNIASHKCLPLSYELSSIYRNKSTMIAHRKKAYIAKIETLNIYPLLTEIFLITLLERESLTLQIY